MFFKPAVFKKLIKEAYTGTGLLVGRAEDDIFLCGGYWAIWMEKDRIPKKLKAAIIELAGEFPVNNQLFSAKKGEEQNEAKEWKEIYNPDEYKRLLSQEYAVTKLSLDQRGTKVSILQNEERKIVLINEVFIDLVDKEVIESRDERPPFGPIGIKGYSAVFWYNDICALLAYPRTTGDNQQTKELIETLETIKVESWVN